MNEGRFELKYLVHQDTLPTLIDLAETHAQVDANAVDIGHGRKGYIVSSLYLDTHDLLGYRERLRMDRIRNRVRVRTYGHPGDGAPVFLEAKRKLDDKVIKHRVKVTDAETWATWGERPWQHSPDSRVARRFLDHVDGFAMEPVSIVRYERQIWTSGSVRLTLDHDVRAVGRPAANDLYAHSTHKLIPPEWVVLELKFDEQPPGWMREVARVMRLRTQPVSKFALSVLHCLRDSNPAEMQRLQPREVRVEPQP